MAQNRRDVVLSEDKFESLEELMSVEDYAIFLASDNSEKSRDAFTSSWKYDFDYRDSYDISQSHRGHLIKISDVDRAIPEVKAKALSFLKKVRMMIVQFDEESSDEIAKAIEKVLDQFPDVDTIVLKCWGKKTFIRFRDDHTTSNENPSFRRVISACIKYQIELSLYHKNDMAYLRDVFALADDDGRMIANPKTQAACNRFISSVFAEWSPSLKGLLPEGKLHIVSRVNAEAAYFPISLTPDLYATNVDYLSIAGAHDFNEHLPHNEKTLVVPHSTVVEVLQLRNHNFNVNFVHPCPQPSPTECDYKDMTCLSDQPTLFFENLPALRILHITELRSPLIDHWFPLLEVLVIEALYTDVTLSDDHTYKLVHVIRDYGSFTVHQRNVNQLRCFIRLLRVMHCHECPPLLQLIACAACIEYQCHPTVREQPNLPATLAELQRVQIPLLRPRSFSLSLRSNHWQLVARQPSLSVITRLSLSTSYDRNEPPVLLDGRLLTHLRKLSVSNLCIGWTGTFRSLQALSLTECTQSEEHRILDAPRLLHCELNEMETMKWTDATRFSVQSLSARSQWGIFLQLPDLYEIEARNNACCGCCGESKDNGGLPQLRYLRYHIADVRLPNVILKSPQLVDVDLKLTTDQWEESMYSDDVMMWSRSAFIAIKWRDGEEEQYWNSLCLPRFPRLRFLTANARVTVSHIMPVLEMMKVKNLELSGVPRRPYLPRLTTLILSESLMTKDEQDELCRHTTSLQGYYEGNDEDYLQILSRPSR